jgi:hypothetical protein
MPLPRARITTAPLQASTTSIQALQARRLLIAAVSGRLDPHAGTNCAQRRLAELHG